MQGNLAGTINANLTLQWALEDAEARQAEMSRRKKPFEKNAAHLLALMEDDGYDEDYDSQAFVKDMHGRRRSDLEAEKKERKALEEILTDDNGRVKFDGRLMPAKKLRKRFFYSGDDANPARSVIDQGKLKGRTNQNDIHDLLWSEEMYAIGPGLDALVRHTRSWPDFASRRMPRKQDDAKKQMPEKEIEQESPLTLAQKYNNIFYFRHRREHVLNYISENKSTIVAYFHDKKNATYIMKDTTHREEPYYLKITFTKDGHVKNVLVSDEPFQMPDSIKDRAYRKAKPKINPGVTPQKRYDGNGQRRGLATTTGNNGQKEPIRVGDSVSYVPSETII